MAVAADQDEGLGREQNRSCQVVLYHNLGREGRTYTLAALVEIEMGAPNGFGVDSDFGSDHPFVNVVCP